MRTFLRELRFGLRMVAKAPGASLVAMLALGLGIGANTAIFSIANGILLHPLPYAHLDRMLDLAEHSPRSGPADFNSVSPATFQDWSQQAHSFSAIAAYRYDQVNLSGEGTPAMVQGALISANFFDLLPSRLLAGRTFLPEEARPGADREVILSQPLWEHQFAANPRIVGQTVELDQQAYTVVGVMSKQAVMPQAAELWMPLALTSQQFNARGDHYLRVIGELKPGVTQAQATADLAAIAARNAAAYPATNQGWGVNLRTLSERIVGQETTSYVLLLLGAVGFLLLIACANVANLQFARALGRNHELAIRTALGAGRGRLMRQMLTENIVLGLGGALVGIAFAAISIKLVLAYMPADVAVFIGGWDQIKLDRTALFFTLAIALAAGILAGLAPAWHASRPDLNSTLKEGGRGAIGHSRRRLRAALVVLQVALALILLVGAGLMSEGFNALLKIDHGYQPEATLTAAVNLPRTPPYATPSARKAFFDQALAKLAALPGVTDAAIADFLPLGNNLSQGYFSIEGQPATDASQARYAVTQSITPNFFSMMGLRFLAGHGFTASDGPDQPGVAVISASIARRYWPGRGAIGQHIKLGQDDSKNPWLTVVGVAPDVQWAWGDNTVESTLYLPAAQQPHNSAYFLLRRSGGGDVTSLGAAARQAVASVDANLPLYDVKSLAESIHESTIGIAYVSVMLSVAGLIALVLAAIGVYGVMAYLVSERLHEFGIRRSLGASSGAIVGLVLRRGGGMLAWGLAIGLPLAYFLARGLQSLIMGISAGDLATYAGISFLLAVMALIACVVPAVQATRVDPLVALREP